jgi:hypothetical protein
VAGRARDGAAGDGDAGRPGGVPGVRGRRGLGARTRAAELAALHGFYGWLLLTGAGGQARVVGKGSRERTVLLPPVLLPTLAAFVEQVRPQLPDSPLLLANAHPFVTTALHGFGQEALSREVELAGLGAGVGGRHHPHKWRRTFATELTTECCCGPSSGSVTGTPRPRCGSTATLSRWRTWRSRTTWKPSTTAPARGPGWAD